LTKDQIDQLATQLRGPVTWRILKSGWTWLGAISLGLVLLGSSYLTIRARVEEVVTSQIAQKFAETRIRETFQKAAENQASKMLKDEIQPAVEQFRADLQNEYQAVLEEVSRLRIQNNLPILGDRAISEADRGALEEITSIAQTAPENSSLRKAAIEEFKRVENEYDSGGRRHTTEQIIAIKPEDGRVRWQDDGIWIKKDITTAMLIMRLSDPDWKVRGKSALLLGGRKEKGVPDILLKLARVDQNLDVVMWAVRSFRTIQVYELGLRQRCSCLSCLVLITHGTLKVFLILTGLKNGGKHTPRRSMRG